MRGVGEAGRDSIQAEIIESGIVMERKTLHGLC